MQTCAHIRPKVLARHSYAYLTLLSFNSLSSSLFKKNKLKVSQKIEYLINGQKWDLFLALLQDIINHFFFVKPLVRVASYCRCASLAS